MSSTTAIIGSELTHTPREPTASLSDGTHEPAMCDHEANCRARDYCGHAKIHTAELMYDHCAGHHCSFLGEYVRCLPI